MFYSQALTNLKTADTFSMRTLCRMTKIEDTTPVNTSRATITNNQKRRERTQAIKRILPIAQKNNQAIEMHLTK